MENLHDRQLLADLVKSAKYGDTRKAAAAKIQSSMIDAVISDDKEKVAFSMSSIDHKKVGDDFIDLCQQYTFEEAETFLSTGKSVDRKELSNRVVNRASEELMRKYSITMPEMVKIVKRASSRMSLG